ncbi:hypothetical protein MRB53_004134 [Persea americana]|uniref:Uncharacterized protein n=1 Tax=Persea americana TaxID=3435 RepID=A0ACC2N1D9_PERAE|nr:hypothetical protein MRB53_004134 [Persea americana]
MSWTTLLWVLSIGVLFFAYLLRAVRGKWVIEGKSMLPPGPPGLPILGNLHMLGELPHHDLYRLAKKYGPIMYLRLGFVPTIVVSSPQAAQQFLKTHDLIFATRPITEAAKYMSYERKGMSFNEYGPYWRSVRKLCTLELLSNRKIDQFKPTRREELGLIIGSIKDMAKACVAVDLSAKVTSLTANMTCLMVFGRKYMDEDLDERGFKGVMEEGMILAATFNLADYIPFIGPLDLQGLNRRMKAFSKVFDAFFENIISEHEKTRERGHQRDFVDVLLDLKDSNDTDLQLDRPNIKAIILDMLAAGMDTSSTAIEWALSDMLKHPQVLKKVQEELERVVGLERMVEESDLANLDYFDMVVKESMRLHPVAPLLIPHEAMEDCTVNGFHIPKRSRVIINVWAIGQDPEVWPNPQEFIPERFAGTNIDVTGRDFQLLPFGSGRRGCPGLQLGLTVVRLVLAQLVHCFDWELPDGLHPSDLDMSEKFSLVVPRANHLLAIPTYRLRGCTLSQ